MAVIGNIRKHSTFLIIIIGVALAAFVLGDFAKGRRGSREVNIGNVAGEDITIMDFNQRVEQNIENTKQQQKKVRLTTDEIYRVKEDTWKQMVKEVLLEKEYESLGLTVTTEELFDLVQGPNPHPLIKQYFTDPETGQYEAAKSIGMPSLQALRRIILPQAMRVIIPPVGNEFISMVKMTSLASVIQYSELLHNAQNIYYANARVMELLIVAGIWYLAVVTVLSFGQSRLERRFARGAGKRS